jgi:hypothetical protein
MGKGGVYGSYVLCEFKGGTSKEYPAKEGPKEKNAKNKKSPMVYIKGPVADFFGWESLTKKDMIKAMTRTVTTTINGKEQQVSKVVNMGTTGASRSVTVKFTKLEKINGKDVASVKLAMPTSYTFGDMIQKILESNKGTANIAAIVSPDGSSKTFGTPYNPKNKGAKLGK